MMTDFNGGQTAMVVHYKGITQERACSVMQRDSKKRFVSSSFIRPLYLLNEILEGKTRSLFWIVWNADVLCWTATEESTLYLPENTQALKTTERVCDTTGCLNQNASFTPAICEFTNDIHYSYTLAEAKWYAPSEKVWETSSLVELQVKAAQDPARQDLIKLNTSTGEDPENIGRSLQIRLFLQTLQSTFPNETVGHAW